ncbi:MAG: 1,4-alpha-glucan branching protein GlgB [Saprospiraceae bacterium]
MGVVRPFSKFTEFDLHLFRQGKHYNLYDKLGSHLVQHEKEDGVYFAVWAPNARFVSVVGTFNSWNKNSHSLILRNDGSGIWEGFIPGIGKGTLYKYFIIGADGTPLEKGDPFALFWETPPKTASIVWDLDFDWKDKKWLNDRKQANDYKSPMSVYEVHLGSWRKKANGDSYSYRELAEVLVPYVKETGFTHVEMLPVMEHPYYPSWGYQITGYFATTSRFGTPQDFMYLMDAFHKEGIGVILDWVPSHFPGDGHGLAYFDGTHLYEHADPRKGFHPDWKSYIFNYGRYEVRSFLLSNALFWLEKFHVDGLRVDAVASMLYLDYSREEGQWIPNEFGGRDNLEAISFLKEFNEVVYDKYPDVVTIAEESTAWPMVSRPTYEGGLGFGQKWMMGWMHDTLKYFKEDPINRKYHHGAISFSMIYAFDENFMLPLSHDEVVHMKAPLIYKMPGDEWQKFANLRLLYGYMFTHSGTKLLFMGGEFAQTSEWSETKGLDWHLLEHGNHKNIQRLVSDLNALYKNKPALHQMQFQPEGFEWIDLQDYENSVLVYLRKGEKGEKPLVICCNFTPVERDHYNIGLPFNAKWTEVFNTDAAIYGGTDARNEAIKVVKKKYHNLDYSCALTLPPLSMICLEPDKVPSSWPKVKKAAVKKPASKKTVTKKAD